MATWAAGTAVVGAIGVAGWCVARAAVAAIERNPDPFSRAQLAREPEGEQVLIHRPDGTVIRAVVAGEGPTVVLANAYGAPLAEWNIL
jgi:non-heme chloroperoxidase